MDIIVKGRRTEVNARFKRHVDAKLAKIERLDSKIIRVDVEVSSEPNPRMADQRERVELTIHSKGPVIRAEAAADDRYGALDMALDKLDSRLRRSADRRKVHHGLRTPPKLTGIEPMPSALPPIPSLPEPGSAETVTMRQASRNGRSRYEVPESSEEYEPRRPVTRGPLPREEPDGTVLPLSMDGDCPVVVREKAHKSGPMDIDQALYEMELVGHDFFLFSDKESGLPSVVYRRRGWDYGVIRLHEE